MESKFIENVSDWMPLTNLKKINENISEFGYCQDYVTEHELRETKDFHWYSGTSGRTCFWEPLEVTKNNGEVFYRERNYRTKIVVPDSFDSQFGMFTNKNRGEFVSCLLKEKPEMCIIGNFCDMFDCGEYTYAVSNLAHMFFGNVKVVQFRKYLNSLCYRTICDNRSLNASELLEYLGRIHNGNNHMIFVSGSFKLEDEPSKIGNSDDIDKTLMLQIDENGGCTISQEWNTRISSSNSIVSLDGYAYFGHNKMVTRLNLATGEYAYFTSKSDVEIAALGEM